MLHEIKNENHVDLNVTKFTDEIHDLHEEIIELKSIILTHFKVKFFFHIFWRITE